MALHVIGAGFGRTGTLSLKLALERLGFAPCYHMVEVAGNPGHAARWHAAARGEPVDWDALLGGYAASVDWPACSFWRALAARHPGAKVVLTVRDADRWYDSVRDTIYRVMRAPLPEGTPEAFLAQQAMARELVLERTFGGRFEDRAHAKAVYARHNEAVRRGLPPERLLVYEVSEGWEPLCAFLERDAPDGPFPRVNSREEFLGRVGAGPRPPDS